MRNEQRRVHWSVLQAKESSIHTERFEMSFSKTLLVWVSTGSLWSIVLIVSLFPIALFFCPVLFSIDRQLSNNFLITALWKRKKRASPYNWTKNPTFRRSVKKREFPRSRVARKLEIKLFELLLDSSLTTGANSSLAGPFRSSSELPQTLICSLS